MQKRHGVKTRDGRCDTAFNSQWTRYERLRNLRLFAHWRVGDINLSTFREREKGSRVSLRDGKNSKLSYTLSRSVVE